MPDKIKEKDLYTEDTAGNQVIQSDYQDPQNPNKFATKLTEEKVGVTQYDTDSNTGGGLDAALGTTYSWDKKAAERADLTYKSDVLNAKANYLQNRQNIESQGQQAQEQVDMQKYAQNQSADKVGWTGGYVLDTERQMNYLKSTIQAQMYGQMELQRYGYDTSLAAARLAYDTNKYDLALEYYNTAINRAVTEFNATNIYVSPEAREMTGQYTLAAQVLNDESASQAEKDQAASVLKSVESWFKDNGISPAGIKAYETIIQEGERKAAIRKAYGVNEATMGIDNNTFVKVQDGYNSYNLGEGTVETVNFADMSGSDLLNYFKGDSTGVATQQYYSRLDGLGYEMENNFTTWCKAQGYIDAEGNANTDDFITALKEYIASDHTANKIQQELSKFEGTDKEELTKLIEGWSVPIALPDGSSVDLVLKDMGSFKGSSQESGKENGETPQVNYMKPQKSAKNVMNLLQTDAYSDVYNAIANINVDDFTNIDALMGSLLGIGGTGTGAALGLIQGIQATIAANSSWAASLAGYGSLAANVTAGLSATGVGAIVAVGVDTAITYISDIFTHGAWEDKRIILEATRDTLLNCIGKDNLALIEADVKRFNSMSEYDKRGLSEKDRQTYEDMAKFYKNYAGIIQAIDYCGNRDSSLYDSKLFEYTGDLAGRIGDRWEDGYDFGDGIGTVIDAGKVALTGVAEFGLMLVGKGWLW